MTHQAKQVGRPGAETDCAGQILPGRPVGRPRQSRAASDEQGAVSGLA